MNLVDQIKELVSVDLFGEGKEENFFVGRPFYLDYTSASLLIADVWKNKVGGIPQGTFLLAFYENEEDVEEGLLLRAIKPTKLPTDEDIVRSMVEYYKDGLNTSGSNNQLDDFTRYEFSFSGLECKILGTFYRNSDDKVKFGADVENFYSAHNYKVYKPTGKVLETIVNYRDGSFPGRASDVKIGKVRYSSSLRFQEKEAEEIPVYVSPIDFLGKRTALFGMTRTGKSNTVKKVIQATVDISDKAEYDLSNNVDPEENLNPLIDGKPKYPVGQIVFDINGEYANPNLQDKGTAIYDLYRDKVFRYSVVEKPYFRVMKTNFYEDVLPGFELISTRLREESSDYVKSFLSVSLEKPDDYNENRSSRVRFDRKLAAYKCSLFLAGFKPSNNRVSFEGHKDINNEVGINPKQEVSYEEATQWFNWVWDNYESHDFFLKYKEKKKKEWADDDLKALLVFLSRKTKSGGNANVTGFRKLRTIKELHTNSKGESFEKSIINQLRDGKIVIVDLSQGNPEIQKLYSEKICKEIFQSNMNRFIATKPNNFIQFYFEEAHNLFPKKDDKDLSQVYNRIAKEGAKLNLGLVYATQEVSSISSNILKNTQNWFVSHLNNDDELRELKKYYDYADFVDGLTKFSADTDKGFVRVKTYSNPFIVPVQIDKFP